MKCVIVRMGLLLSIPLLFSTCHKLDWDFFGSHGKKDCLLESYTLPFYGDLGYPFLFKKKFNRAGDRVTEINCSFNNILPIEELIHYDLRVVYNDDEVYLINKADATDTTLKVYLNAHGRPRECIGKSDFIFRNRFFYHGNRLRAIEFDTPEFSQRDTCEYDSRGNILSISYRDNFSNMRIGYFYQYDYSKKAKQQFYFDEIRDLNNDFALLQYLGAFPELEPVNIRTHSRLGLEVGSAAWDKYLVNHRIDAKGKLLDYDVAFWNGSMPVPEFKASLGWKCK